MSTRLNGLRTRMAEQGCDAFISLSSPINQYFTGFMGTTSAVVVTANAAHFLCDFRYTEVASEVVDKAYTVTEVKGNLATRAGECLTSSGVTAVGFDPGYLLVSELHSIQKGYAGRMEPKPDLVSPLRMIKTTSEIQLIRDASALAEGVLADAKKMIRPGVTEREVAAWMEFEFKRRGASGPSFETIVLFGPRSSLPHGQPGDTPLRLGDVVLIDFGCRRHGYCSDLTRTYAFGTIPGVWFEEVYGLVLESQRKALKAIKPGLTGRQVDEIARSHIAAGGHGDHFGHGLGHGLGIEIHEAPRLNTESDVILKPGMVVTVEPGIYLPGQGGVRIEDVVVVTGDGCELLSSTPKELEVLRS
ncbi:MAG: aminopeptidase [Candidatus Hydrogenedentota bacterium]